MNFSRNLIFEMSTVQIITSISAYRKHVKSHKLNIYNTYLDITCPDIQMSNANELWIFHSKIFLKLLSIRIIRRLMLNKWTHTSSHTHTRIRVKQKRRVKMKTDTPILMCRVCFYAKQFRYDKVCAVNLMCE